MDIYVVHWSKYNELDGEDVKIAAANKLADDAEKSSNNYKIFVGDFNTEPYSKPMSHLKASRSIQYVIDRGGFYNPFWRHLHMEGTINYCSPRSIKCYFPTFDQILIDRNLLSEKRLRLNSFILGDSFYDPPKGEHRPIGITFHTQEDKESQNGI